MAQSAWQVIARREFWERVKNRWFLVVTILGPLFMVGVLVVPAWLIAKSSKDVTKIAVVDESAHDLAKDLAAHIQLTGENIAFEPIPLKSDRAGLETELKERIKAETLDGYLLVPPDVLEGGKVMYRGDNATNMRLVATIPAVLTMVVIQKRASVMGLAPTQVIKLISPVNFSAEHTTGEGEAKNAQATFFLGYAVMMIMYMSVLLYGINVMRSVVLEKTSRVVEIIVSSTKPWQLMMGKVIGVGSVGIAQIAVWAATGLCLMLFKEQVLGFFGLPGGGISMPAIGVSETAVIAIYFMFGYFFYAALYAAVGSMVNSDQEAQQLQTPVMMLLILPVVCVGLVTNDPRGGAAQLLTMLPFSSPILMPMRYLLGGATLGEVAVSSGILAISAAGAIFVAARIYRIGILMYGKRPSLKELARWVRYG